MKKENTKNRTKLPEIGLIKIYLLKIEIEKGKKMYEVLKDNNK